MKKLETIKSSKEIDYIFRNGDKFSFPFLNLIFCKDEKINGEVAFLAGKKNGNAVWRNKSKRILREVYKKINFNKEYKALLIANKKISEFKQEEMVKKIEEDCKIYIN